MDTLNTWIKPAYKEAHPDNDPLNRVWVPTGDDLKLLQTRLALFFDNLIADSLYHQPMRGGATVHNDAVRGYLCINYDTKIKTKKHKYLSMIYKGIRKLAEDVKYYAPNYNNLMLEKDMIGIKLVLQASETASKQELLVYEHGKMFYKAPGEAGRDLSKEEVLEVLEPYKNKRLLLSIYVWYKNEET